MGFIRSGLASVGALALIAGSSVASAQVRPSDSIVSAERAATATPVARQGAPVENASALSPEYIALLIALLIAAGYGVSELFSESP